MTTVPLADLMVLNTRSRFAVLEAPTKTPGKCAVCGSPHRPVVDLGLNIQRYGFVMICFDCVSEMGQRIGLVLAEDLENASLQAGQSVEDYLASRDLKVISHELYESLFVVVSMFTADAVHIPGNLFDSVDDETQSDAQGKFEFGDESAPGQSDTPSDSSDPFDLRVD